MSKQTARLAAYLQNNKLIVASVVTGIVAIGAIAGVLAWSNNTGSTEQPKETAQTEQKDTEQKPEEKKNEETAANTDNSGDTAVLGDSTSTESAPAPVVETAAVTPQPATSQPSTPSVPSDNEGNNENNNPGENGNNQQPGQGGGDTGTGNENQNPGTGTGDNGNQDPGTPGTCATNRAPAYTGARVSLTFDDGWKSIYANGLQLLTKYGLASTQYINSQPTVDGYTGYMTYENIAAFAQACHEIAWHTNTHNEALQNINTVDQTTLTNEIKPNQAFVDQLSSLGVTLSDNYAAPFGTSSQAALDTATANGFTTYRTTDDGYNLPGSTNFTSIKVKNICGVAGLEACGGQATTPEEVAAWIAQAQQDNAWLVIVFHEVAEFTRDAAAANPQYGTCDADPADGGDPNACVVDPSYAVTPGNLDLMLKEISDAQTAGLIKVQTVDDAVADLTTQVPAL